MTNIFKLAPLVLACGGEVGELFPAGDAGGDVGSVEHSDLFVHYAPGEGPQLEALEGELGQAAFALTRIGSHGIESSNQVPSPGLTCIEPWETGFCNATSSKVRKISFSANTCNSWWQARFVEVYHEFNWNHNDFGWAWGDGGGDGTIRCGGTLPDGGSMPNSMLGVTWFDPPFTDVAQSPYGTVRRWAKSTTRINVAGIEAMASWAGKTDTQRKRAARSVIRHEFYHSMGRGHNSYPGSLMHPAFDEAHYYSDIQLRTEERDSFNAYVP